MRSRKFSQVERSFWREAFLAADLALLLRSDEALTPDEAARRCAAFADAAVEVYRARITWASHE